MYKATEKFKTLSRANHHQGLSKADFDSLLAGGKVKDVPKKLIEKKYVEKIKKVEANHGN